MKLLAHKYHLALSMKDDFLLDEVILKHAWKKAHHSIRSTNWYSDIFELDSSAIELEQNVSDWSDELQKKSLEFSPLQLVPAPKTTSWEFDKDDEFTWKPKVKIRDGDDGNCTGLKALRPLAHIEIREQTIMTALMMLLANQVETEQGDTSLDFDGVHEKGVVNYGNRLYCHYHDNKASFLWGNQSTYNQYFKDYQQFLARPIFFGKKAKSTAIESELIYEVHLDLAKFYDKVNRSLLIEKVSCFIRDEEDAVSVQAVLKAFKEWKWCEGSDAAYELVCSSADATELPDGIPQGLVAGGFLSNIYLLDFDKEMSDKIGETLGSSSITLVDYCRYVDDMRLIIKVNQDDFVYQSIEDTLKKAITSYVEAELPENLCLNHDKTHIERFSLKTLGISNTLKDIQTKVSGPLSNNSLDEQLGHLEGLIGLAESLRDQELSNQNTNPLARIESPSLDVREDTLLRFTANKIHKLLQQKRSLVAQEIDDNGEPIPGDWDYLQERMARRFIAAWSKDPSLIVLLKKGLELFPDPRLLTPVLDQLKDVLLREGDSHAKEVQVAIFCLGEIIRHAATVIHSKDRWSQPAQAQVEVFFGILLTEAISCIQKYSDIDKFKPLVTQARLLCLAKNDSPFELETSDVSFNVISKMMKGYRNISGITGKNFFITALLAYKLGWNKSDVVKSICHVLVEKLSHKPSRIYVENCIKLASEATPLFEKIFFYAKQHKQQWINTPKIKELVKTIGVELQPYLGDLTEINNQDVSLLSLVKRADNPFAHENAVLKLIETILLCSSSAFNSEIDFVNTKVRCVDWQNLQSLDVVLECDLKFEKKSIFGLPEWVESEHKPFYRLGMFIRSCLVGSVDWTQNAFASSGFDVYRGIKTSFAKRQIGMMQSPESFHGEMSPTSNWLAELLFFLLQHPGIQFTDDHCFSIIKDWSGLTKVISQRILEQKSLYCSLSGIPSYVEKVNLKWDDLDKKKKSLKVVMVQSLLPMKKDFGELGLKLDDPQYRARHRRHVASVSELILHKVSSHNSIEKEHSNKIEVDLMVWPELAVNYDDIDILQRLSDKTGSMILTGLTFLNIPGIKGPNNVAMWLIPNKKENGRQFIKRLQGKQHMMKDERGKVFPWRPYQLIVELIHPAFKDKQGFRLSSSVCFDATDLKIAADLKEKTDAYLIPSLNQDVATFDNMVDALYYHMYQHVVLVNTGEFGGSVAKAPYKGHDKLITHVHGAYQVSISSFEMNMFDFRDIGLSFKSGKAVKAKPAG